VFAVCSDFDPDLLAAEAPPPAAVAAAAAAATPVDNNLVMLTQSGRPLRLHKEVWGLWARTDYGAIKVRSIDYVTSGVKIAPPCPPAMEIAHLEMYLCDTKITHVTSRKGNWLREHRVAHPVSPPAGAAASGAGGAAAASASKATAGAAAAKPSPSSSGASSSKSSPPVAASADSSPADSDDSDVDEPDDDDDGDADARHASGAGLRPFDADFFFVVTFFVQSSPTFHLTLYFRRSDFHSSGQSNAGDEEHAPAEASAARRAFDTLFARFIAGNSAFRNARLKLIPFVVDGGWFAAKAVGNRPCIIGNKVRTTTATQTCLAGVHDGGGRGMGSQGCMCGDDAEWCRFSPFSPCLFLCFSALGVCVAIVAAAACLMVLFGPRPLSSLADRHHLLLRSCVELHGNQHRCFGVTIGFGHLSSRQGHSPLVPLMTHTPCARAMDGSIVWRNRSSALWCLCVCHADGCSHLRATRRI
jgi:hypothetical protein